MLVMRILSVILPLLLYVPLLISQQNKKPPNILLVLVDDMGNSDASFNFKITNPTTNKPPILTPNLDYFANNGIIFANHYTNMICGPTRSALITSRFAYKLGNPFAIRDKGHIRGKYHTFAHELQSRGYRNHFIGKYGIDQQDRLWNRELGQYMPPMSSMRNETGPLSRGFHTFYGLYNSGHNHFTKSVIGVILDWHKFNETHLLEAPHNLDPEIDKSSTHLFTRETINAIQQDTKNNQPWFIHLSFTMPHDPMQVNDKYITDFQHCAKMTGWRRKIYCGMVTSVDEGIGNITRYLKKHNLLENTVVIFSSDNGGFSSVGGFNYPFRGMKISPYEGGVKTIAFIYGTNIFPNSSGRVFKNNIHIVDWGPTLLGIVDSEMGNELKHKMGDIDGWDYSETLKQFVDTNNNNLLNRNEFIVESRWWNNITVYRYNEYKLFLGTQMYDQLFIEPNDAYALNSNDRAKSENYDWILSDYINYFIANILGPDYFFYEWNFAGINRFVWLRLTTAKGCPKMSRPTLKNRPGNMTFFWPYIDTWDEKCQRVRLYNLDQDPTESNNLAYKPEYRHIVDDMMKRLTNKLKQEYELNQIENDINAEGLMVIVEEMQWNIFRTVVIIFGLIIVMIVFCCWKCCFKSNTKNKRKTD